MRLRRTEWGGRNHRRDIDIEGIAVVMPLLFLRQGVDLLTCCSEDLRVDLLPGAVLNGMDGGMQW
ncbi:hypothetical protein D3C73_875660 [compost metagenome]